MKILIRVLFWISLTSCYYVSLKDGDASFKLKEINTWPFCSKFEVVTLDESLNVHFKKIISSAKSYNLNFIERAVLLSLLQMNYFPHISAPSAYLEINYKYKGKTASLSVSSDTPYLSTLNILLKNTKSRKITELAVILDKYKQDVHINSSLASFLGNLENTNYYLRGGYKLNLRERLPSFNFAKIVKNVSGKVINDYKFFKRIQNVEIFCNKDLSTIKDFSEGKVGIANPFFLAAGDDYFLANSSISYDKKIVEIKGTPFFKGYSSFPYGLICKTNDQEIYFYSFNSVDPDQILVNLLNNINDFNINQLVEEINRPRSLKLDSPKRIIYEAERQGSRVSDFFKLNYPVHFARNLGSVWVYQNKLSTVILDNRIATFCN